MADSENQVSLAQEWESWKSPSAREVSPVPQIGDKAPVHPNLSLSSGKSIIVFLRHCGCPFAEKTFRKLATLSTVHKNIHCIAVSHSSSEATERWVTQVGGNWEVEVLVDQERELYSQWGLGISNTWHVLNPVSLYRTFRLGTDENIWNRPTESGSRWQTSGAFAVDADGIIKWAKVAATADDVPDLDAALKSLGVEPKKQRQRSTFEGMSGIP